MSGVLAEIERDVVQPCVTLWALGGPSIAVRTPQAVLYVDLFTGPSPREDLVKLTSDIIDTRQVRRADAVLCTHVHLDHCHEGSLRPLHKHTDAIFIAPKSCCDALRKWGFEEGRVVEMLPGNHCSVRDVLITAVPTRDWSDPYAVGFVLEVQGVTLYDGGDCLYAAHFLDIGRQWEIDVALMNFARNPSPDLTPFMEPEEVVQAAKDLRARRILLKHWDLWRKMFASPEHLIELLTSEGFDAIAMTQGDKVVLTAPAVALPQ